MACRVIVVGSGIVGASCAYYASCRGAQVVLVDSLEPGQATAAGAGIVCPWSSRLDDPAWYAFASAAARAYPRLVDDLARRGEADVGYRRVGALSLADTREQRDQSMRRLLALRAEAPEIGKVRALRGSEAQGMFPPLRADCWAVYIGGAGRVDGRLLTAALIRAAVRNGASTRTGRARLQCRSGRAAGVILDGQLIEGDAVVVAAGAWTSAFLEKAGLAVAVTPQRGQIAHISVAPADTSRWPVVLPGGSGHYLLAFDDCRVVAGATRETGAGFDYRVTPGGLAEVLAQALAVAPGLASGTYLSDAGRLSPGGARRTAAARSGARCRRPGGRDRPRRHRPDDGPLCGRYRRTGRGRGAAGSRSRALRPAPAAAAGVAARGLAGDHPAQLAGS